MPVLVMKVLRSMIFGFFEAYRPLRETILDLSAVVGDKLFSLNLGQEEIKCMFENLTLSVTAAVVQFLHHQGRGHASSLGEDDAIPGPPSQSPLNFALSALLRAQFGAVDTAIVCNCNEIIALSKLS